MHNSRDNNDQYNAIDFDFFDEDCDKIKYPKHNSNDYYKIVTKAVIETNQQLLSSNNSENYIFSSASSSSENICKDAESEDKYLVNCLSCNENATEKGDTLSDNDISDISSESSKSSRISLFTSVSPLTLSESSCTLDEYSESSSEVNETETFSTNENLKQKPIKETEKETVPVEEQPNGNEVLCESKPKDNEYIGEEDERDVVEGDRYFEQRSEISAGILERAFSELSEEQNNSNSSSNQSTVSRGASKLGIRKKDLNLTFSREEMIKIERDNLILLKKIMAHSKPRSVSLNKPFTNKKTSSAINRAKQQKKIEQDNYILHSKISAIGRMKKVF